MKLPRTVWALAAVSLLNDAASEMIAPLLPLFLTLTLGAGPAIVALVEGVSDATSSILKLLSGRWSDRGVSTRRLIIGGYGVANLARPLLGLATSWGAVLALRFLDRVGKGLRSAPRDALLAASVPVERRGRAFGVHRAADHVGSVIGPMVATALLLSGVPLRTVFLAAAVFGAAVILTVWRGLPRDGATLPKPSAPAMRWRTLERRTRALLIAVTVLAAVSVPEIMVVLWATERGLDIVWVPLLWAAAHAVKAVIAWPAGLLVDRWGPGRVLAVGWPMRVVALLGLAGFAGQTAGIWLAFAFYSSTLAMTEAAERALLAASVPAYARGTAFGWFHLLTGVAILPGSLMLGVVWEKAGAATALTVAAVGAALACVAAASTWRGDAIRAP